MSLHQAALRAGQPIWLSRQPPRRRFPRCRGRQEAGIVVVGGGITGVLIAEASARAGVAVVLLEAGLVGRGSTAASSALLLREPDISYRTLLARHGAAAGGRMWRLCHDGVRDFVATIRRLRISCDLEESDAVYVARTAKAARELEHEFASRCRGGVAGRWLAPAALRALTRIDGGGAIRTSGHAQFDPYKACLGLAQAAVAAGARIFERSPVSRIRSDGTRVHVESAGGTAVASRVVIATGYATPQFRPLTARFRMYRTYVLATQRLTASERNRIGFGRAMLWDSERPYHYARWTPDGRLLLGGGDRPVGPRRRDDFRAATRQLRDDFLQLLPGLAPIRIESAWEGLFAQTPDSFPYIGLHRRYPRHLFALGYGGNGMAFSTLAARLLLDHCLGGKPPDLDLFAFSRDQRQQEIATSARAVG